MTRAFLEPLWWFFFGFFFCLRSSFAVDYPVFLFQSPISNSFRGIFSFEKRASEALVCKTRQNKTRRKKKTWQDRRESRQGCSRAKLARTYFGVWLRRAATFVLACTLRIDSCSPTLAHPFRRSLSLSVISSRVRSRRRRSLKKKKKKEQ